MDHGHSVDQSQFSPAMLIAKIYTSNTSQFPVFELSFQFLGLGYLAYCLVHVILSNRIPVLFDGKQTAMEKQALAHQQAKDSSGLTLRSQHFADRRRSIDHSS